MERLSRDLQGGRSLRQSNFELLRIFAMLMIVAHHLSVHGKLGFAADTVTFNRLWMQFLRSGGKLGVDIFVLISGWFMIAERKLRVGKIVRLWVQILTYSVILFAVFTATGVESFTWKELRNRCLPVIYEHWWFVSVYFVMFLIAPFFNRLLHALSKRQYAAFLILFGVLWCLIPTVSLQDVQSNNLFWFLYVYALAGYLRLHCDLSKRTCGFYFLLAGLSVLCLFGSAVVLDVLGIRYTFFRSHTNYFFGTKMLPTIAAAVFIFLGFSRIDIGSVRWINVLSSTMFGVYLLHDDAFVRPFLWRKLLHCASYASSRYLFLYSLLWIAGVFCCSVAVELFRIYVIEKRYLPLIDRFAGAVEKVAGKLLTKIT